MVNIMLIDNKFSKRNKLLYKMKCLNTRDCEYDEVLDDEYDRIERYNDIKCINSSKHI